MEEFFKKLGNRLFRCPFGKHGPFSEWKPIQVDRLTKERFYSHVSLGSFIDRTEYLDQQEVYCCKIRKCLTCRKEFIHFEKEHAFDEREYISEGKCEQKLTCVRCGYVAEYNPLEHVYPDKWEYILEGKCKQRKVCARCGDVQEIEHHDYGEWKSSPEPDVISYRTCKRCGWNNSKYYTSSYDDEPVDFPKEKLTHEEIEEMWFTNQMSA